MRSSKDDRDELEPQLNLKLLEREMNERIRPQFKGKYFKRALNYQSNKCAAINLISSKIGEMILSARDSSIDALVSFKIIL